jgi:hypothetical protein
MKPNVLQTSRNILVTILTVLGVGLFIAVSVRAAHQITDRQYTDGKQRAVPSSASVPLTTLDSAVANTARYATSLTGLAASNPDRQSTSAASPFTPPAHSEAQVITANAVTGMTKDNIDKASPGLYTDPGNLAN